MDRRSFLKRTTGGFAVAAGLRWTSDAEALPPRPPQPEIGDEPSSCTCVKLKGARLEFEAGGFRCYAKEVLVDFARDLPVEAYSDGYEYPDLEVSQLGLQHASIHVVTLGACPEHLVHPAEELMMAQKRVDIACMSFDGRDRKRFSTKGFLVNMSVDHSTLSADVLTLEFVCTEGVHLRDVSGGAA